MRLKVLDEVDSEIEPQDESGKDSKSKPSKVSGKESADDTLPEFYLADMHARKLLTKRQEAELSATILNGGEMGEHAFNELCLHNLRLVVSIARKYLWSELPLDDLVQAGNGGLMRAARKFNGTLGNKFSTYATWWIRQSILRMVVNEGRSIRLPVQKNDAIARMKRQRKALTDELKREPSELELAARLEVKVQVLRELRQLDQMTISLQQTASEDTPLESFIKAPLEDGTESKIESVHFRQDVEKALSILSEKERTILKLHFGLADGESYSLQEIGKSYGVTRERIRQIQVRAIKKIRKSKHWVALKHYYDP